MKKVLVINYKIKNQEENFQFMELKMRPYFKYGT